MSDETEQPWLERVKRRAAKRLEGYCDDEEAATQEDSIAMHASNGASTRFDILELEKENGKLKAQAEGWAKKVDVWKAKEQCVRADGETAVAEKLLEINQSR
ncbi:hypothetical protein HDU98_006316 [Podochytrium sp. JEL0797]|nr:hypothetical protein HDU98_006316 [Podochytrium sp. JEL0797]